MFIAMKDLQETEDYIKQLKLNLLKLSKKIKVKRLKDTLKKL
jgi:hypothetical protein